MEHINPDKESLAKEIEEYFDRLWPILRSITGDGVRKTHDILSEIIPLVRYEVPSGSQVFDWKVPPEWVVRSAYVIAPNGKRMLDIEDNNLHLLNYSAPFKGTVTLEELDRHLFSIPEKPEAIPYRTSYYNEAWGFCISHNDRKSLQEGDYQVVIDTEFINGSMTLSDAVLRGASDKEIMFSTYTCHPSMASNELSGPLIAAFLYRYLASVPERKYTYRFVFVPETIGTVAYLHKYGDHLKDNLIAGYVLTCLGDNGPYTYKQSRIGSSLADSAAKEVLKKLDPSTKILDFFPQGSDERQYCSPGLNLPVGTFMRSMYWLYPEYHTSLDNKTYVCFESMAENVQACLHICSIIENDIHFQSVVQKGEPQLSRRGIYPPHGGGNEKNEWLSAVAWVLNYSDGVHSIREIANLSGYSEDHLRKVAGELEGFGLVKKRTI